MLLEITVIIRKESGKLMTKKNNIKHPSLRTQSRFGKVVKGLHFSGINI